MVRDELKRESILVVDDVPTVRELVQRNLEVEGFVCDSTASAEEDLQRIFEPFYTTKEVGVGTGLGLAILQEIIALHEGELLVESAVEVGTTFRICLPVRTA